MGAGGDVELLVGVGEVGFDGAPGDVELLRDLPVAAPLRRERGDAVFGGGEGVDAGERVPARPGAGGVELAAGAAGEQAHPAAVGELERMAQRPARVGAAIDAPQCGAELDQDAGVLEPPGRASDQVGRGLEQVDTLAGDGGACEGAQSGRAQARQADTLGERKVLLGEAARGGGVAEGDERVGGVDSPAREAGMADAQLLPARGGGEQVGVCVGGAVLGEPQTRAALEQQAAPRTRRPVDRRAGRRRRGRRRRRRARRAR